MLKYCANCAIMHRNAAVISIICILLCFSLNYTFPLHREINKCKIDSYGNLSAGIFKSDRHAKIERTNKITSNLGGALRRIKDSTQEISKNVQARINSVKNAFSEEDLREYEQLVIMKKNPYLDLKDIEQKFSPKNPRHSQRFDAGPLLHNSGDPSIWESVDEGPNVEITNRGLTGFAIPAKIVKNTLKLTQNKSKINSVQSPAGTPTKQNLRNTNDLLGEPSDDNIENY